MLSLLDDVLLTVGGELLYAGKLGKDITLEQGKQAARQCAINAVAALNSQIDLDDIKSIVKVQVFTNCTEDFIQSPEVANGYALFVIFHSLFPFLSRYLLCLDSGLYFCIQKVSKINL